MRFFLLLPLILLYFPVSSMVRAGVDTRYNNFFAYDYDNSNVLYGPGFYFGIWFDNQTQFNNYLYGDRYYYEVQPNYYVRYYYGRPYYYQRNYSGGPTFYFSIDRSKHKSHKRH